MATKHKNIAKQLTDNQTDISHSLAISEFKKKCTLWGETWSFRSKLFVSPHVFFFQESKIENIYIKNVTAKMWRPIFELTISVITKTEGDCSRSPSQQHHHHHHCPHCHLLILNEVFVIDRNTLSTFCSRPVETSVQRAELGFLKSPQFILMLVDNTTSLNPSLSTNTRHTAMWRHSFPLHLLYLNTFHVTLSSQSFVPRILDCVYKRQNDRDWKHSS